MPMGNSYLARRDQERMNLFLAGMDTGFQRAMDVMCAALNDPECMGPKGVLGGDKIERIASYACELDSIYAKAFQTKDPEADLWQERLDAKQRKIFKERTQPFQSRYPYIKEIRYGKKS